MAVQRRQRRLVQAETIFFCGESAVLYFLAVGANRFLDNLAQVCITLGVLGQKIFIEAQNIMKNLHLSVAVWPGTDSDSRDVKPPGNVLCQRRGDRLKDNSERSCLFQRQRIIDQAMGRICVTALNAPAAQLIETLWRQ